MNFETEIVAVTDLVPHPRNYREHPDDQIEHLVQSIRANGLYRNIVTANDLTILAGHGVVLAARKLGIEHVPVVRLDLDPGDPRALKVLAGDNEIEHLATQDDRALSELLKEIHEDDVTDLLGTGYDEMMLANLVFVTRSMSEIADFDEAAEWVGMPEYEQLVQPLKIIVSFANEQDRQSFADLLSFDLTDETKSVWWPPRQIDDLASVRIVAGESPQ